jgi:hypothetical protein
MYRSRFFDLGTTWNCQLHVPAALSFDESTPGTDCIEGWVGPRVGLGGIKSKHSWPNGESNSNRSVVQPVASHYTYYATVSLSGEQGEG